METSMVVDFQILQKINGEYIPISNKEAKAVSIGGFGFEINGAEIHLIGMLLLEQNVIKYFNFKQARDSYLMIMKSQIAMMNLLKKLESQKKILQQNFLHQ